MKYHIDTIPILDAFKSEEGDCPLCLLRKNCEDKICDRFLGASVMEPSTRISVNDMGFCQRHHSMLFDRQNRLGHALMMQSYIIELRKKLEKAFSAATSNSGMFFKKDTNQTSIEKIKGISSSCIICNTLDETNKRYLYSCLHLLITNSDFIELFMNKNVCLKDISCLFEMSLNEFSRQEKHKLIDILKNKTFTSLDKFEKDIDWFTKKFDYKNHDKPWGESKNAVFKLMHFLRGCDEY